MKKRQLNFGSLSLGLALLSAISANATIHYVDLNNSFAASPYTNWADAAVTIQDAIDASVAGDEIVVTNGVYQTGGRLVAGVSTTNRVVVDKAVTVRSVNGSTGTVIHGQQATGGGNGPTAIRCVYMTNGAVLAGFTMTNGATTTGGSGGGLYCVSPSATVTNCQLIGNSADANGGGVYSGALTNCMLIGNSATQGGGAYNAILVNCLVTSNTASSGGGAYGGGLKNCTVVGNSASIGAGGCSSAGLAVGPINSILYYNSAPSYPNFFGSGALYTACCTTPVPTINNFCITNEPLFVDLANGNLRLASNSPCINAGVGTSSFLTPVDLDGNPRVVAGWGDIGAYECQTPALLDFYLWLKSYGVGPYPENQYADRDGDGANNWQEWIAGTNPTNGLSVLQMITVTPGESGLDVTWQRETGTNYFLERSTNLTSAPSFYVVATNLTGLADTTTFTDTNWAGFSPVFYRVGVQQ